MTERKRRKKVLFSAGVALLIFAALPFLWHEATTPTPSVPVSEKNWEDEFRWIPCNVRSQDGTITYVEVGLPMRRFDVTAPAIQDIRLQKNSPVELLSEQRRLIRNGQGKDDFDSLLALYAPPQKDSPAWKKLKSYGKIEDPFSHPDVTETRLMERGVESLEIFAAVRHERYLRIYNCLVLRNGGPAGQKRPHLTSIDFIEDEYGIWKIDPAKRKTIQDHIYNPIASDKYNLLFALKTQYGRYY